MGLVMVGAIEANKAPVDLDQGHADRVADRRRPRRSSCRPSRSTRRSMTSSPTSRPIRPRSSLAGGSAGGPDQLLVGLLAKAAGVAERRPSTSPTRAAARRRPRSCRAAWTPASRASRSSPTRSRPARCARWPSRAPEPIDVGGKSASSDQGRGLRRRDDQLARHRGAARAVRRRSASSRRVRREAARDAGSGRPDLKRFGWADFCQPAATSSSRSSRARRARQARHETSAWRASSRPLGAGRCRRRPRAVPRRRPGIPAPRARASLAARAAWWRSRRRAVATIQIPARRDAVGRRAARGSCRWSRRSALILLSLAFLRAHGLAPDLELGALAAAEAAQTDWPMPGAGRRRPDRLRRAAQPLGCALAIGAVLHRRRPRARQPLTCVRDVVVGVAARRGV